jgi:hypothetical protein
MITKNEYLKALEIVENYRKQITSTNDHCNEPNGFDKCKYFHKHFWVCWMRECKYLIK